MLRETSQLKVTPSKIATMLMIVSHAIIERIFAWEFVEYSLTAWTVVPFASLARSSRSSWAAA